MLFTSIDPTQAPPFIPHLRGGGLLAGRDINFYFNTKEEAIYRAKPYWKAAKSIEILTVETKKYIEKTQETIK